MSRPRCWHCFNQLMYVNGKPVYVIYRDPDGVDHKLHKDCARYGDYDPKSIRPKEQEPSA